MLTLSGHGSQRLSLVWSLPDHSLMEVIVKKKAEVQRLWRFIGVTEKERLDRSRHLIFVLGISSLVVVGEVIKMDSGSLESVVVYWL